MAKKLLVNFKTWNGYENVNFVMDAADWDFRKGLNGENLTKVADVDVKKKRFEHEGNTWLVFSDGSTREAREGEI